MVIVVPLMLCVAYLTLWERKLIGFMQIRIGPNRTPFFGISWLAGLAQPIADGLKLLLKEIIVPTGSNKFLFVLAPIMAIMPALAAWVAIPFGPDVALANVNAGLLLVMAITSIEVYGVIITGLLLANFIEWFFHKHVLHGLGRVRGRFWSFHFHEHHGNARRHAFRDPCYERFPLGWHAQGKEAW
eukprot:gene19288-23634_t